MNAKRVFYKRNNRLISKKIGNEFIIIDPDSDSFSVLNGTGEMIVKFLYQKRSFAEILDRLIAQFNVNETKAKKDINDFLNTGIKTGLIRKYG